MIRAGWHVRRLPSSRPLSRSRFDFLDWAQREGFTYPARAEPLLARVGSPPEAHFVRRFFESKATIYDGGKRAYCRGVSICVQEPCGKYLVDVMAKRGRVELAIEIDGFEFHNATRSQVAADYYRARRLLCAGFVVIRFTASEAMSRVTECWRDVFTVLNTRCALERSA